MNEHFEIRNIGSICNIVTGKLDANAASEGGAYPFFTCSVVPLQIDEYAFDAECVLIAGNGDLNVKYYKGKFNAYQRTYIITLKESVNEISVRYIYYFFLFYIDTLRKNSVGSTIKYIRMGDITELSVPIPSLSTQKHIVNMLDSEFAKIDSLKTNSEANQQNTKDFFQTSVSSLFQMRIKWNRTNLGDIATFKNGLNFSKKEGQHEYRFLGVGDFKENTSIKSSNLNFIFQDTIDAEYFLKDDDIVFVRSNGSRQLVGRSVLIQNGNEKAVYSGFCIRCRLSSNAILPKFLICYLSLERTKQILTSGGGGCNISNLNQKVLASLSIPVPPIKEQEAIIESFSNFKEQCSKLQELNKRIAYLCDDLKQAILRKTFNRERNNP